MESNKVFFRGSGGFERFFIYTLWSTDIAGWEIHQEWRCISYSCNGFSIAMLVYRRVTPT